LGAKVLTRLDEDMGAAIVLIGTESESWPEQGVNVMSLESFAKILAHLCFGTIVE
jgi:hypothetical protein